MICKYNKKYILKKIEEFRRHNPLYDNIEGHVCYLVYLNPGERGWFLHETGVWFDPPHRIHTSIVQDVVYSENQVIVTTENTQFTFEVI